MSDLPAVKQMEIDRSLLRSIDNASSIITKNYLDKLEAYDIIPPSTEDLDIDPKEIGAFFKLSKLVWDRDENFLDKLTTILDVVYSIRCSLVTVISSDGDHIDYYIGILSKEYRKPSDWERRKADSRAFYGALSGNMIGSEISGISGEELEKIQDRAFGRAGDRSIAAVSGIVSLRTDEKSSSDLYVQGIENLVDSLRGMKYTILMIADPVSTDEVAVMKQGYEMLHTQLSKFKSSSVSVTESDAQSLSKARTEGITKGISTGISMTQSKTMSKGKFGSFSTNGAVSMGLAGILGVNIGAGMASGHNTSEANTSGRTSTQTEANQRQQSLTETAGSTKTVGRSLQLNYENRTVTALLDKIDKHLERLDSCESFGAFDCASYCFADTREEALAVASNYNALLRGKESGIQASHINTWSKEDETRILHRYLSSYVHPRFSEKRNADAAERIIVSPSSIVSGNELAIQVGFPKKSITGISVLPMTSFGRNMPKIPRERRIALGKLFHMGREDAGSMKVNLDIESISMHTFITGSTGAGKSTMIYNILDQLLERSCADSLDRKIKFLVIEPAKGEYKDRYAGGKDVSVYGSNPGKTPLLRINPFSFPEDIHVLEHIDRLIEMFNVCWPMYAAMPAVLKEAVERAYEASGWELEGSSNHYRNREGQYLYPTFSDVLMQINRVMEESEYSADSKGDYKGALCTRVKSLTTGIYGQIFAADDIPDRELFDENVIIDLSRIGSAESKALIMGILVMKLQEFRMGQREGMNLPVRHVTVLEEAHNILKRTSSEFSQESANVAGKSVELLANSIAEMRTYGEGFIIADQSPGLMDLSVIRNTNTKIILRLPDQTDRELVGRASSLSEGQILELSRLPTLVASVYQNNWLEPVLCRAELRFGDRRQRYKYQGGNERKASAWRDYVSLLIMPVRKRNELDREYVDKLVHNIYRQNVSAETKLAFLKYLISKSKDELQRYRRRSLYGFFNSERAFSLSRAYEREYPVWYEHICEALAPNIDVFNAEEKQKLIANLVMEDTAMRGGGDAAGLFEKMMGNLQKEVT